MKRNKEGSFSSKRDLETINTLLDLDTPYLDSGIINEVDVTKIKDTRPDVSK